MLCKRCYLMLRGQEGRQWRGTYDLHFDHHKSDGKLRKSANHCFICHTIARDLVQDQFGCQSITNQSGFTAGISILSGDLGVLKERNDFLLEFYREGIEVGKFVLKQATDYQSSLTPTSDYTGSDAVSQQVAKWIKDCKCVSPAKAAFHPTRLIDIQSLKEPKLLSTKPLQETTKRRAPKVKLVGSQDLLDTDRYVTLSHCWGNPTVPPLRLFSENIAEFMTEGIPLRKLPLTFRHAVEFASRLDEVRYIWIDSLCIIQNSGKDWLAESKEMGKVYSNSFLNISASAAKNGDEGLFDYRQPPLLWTDDIDLNVDGIPGIGRKGQENHPIRRCTVLDACFWANYVDQAPLNRRGWVLQERLLAPRNVHFCREQVAWECQCDNGRKSERHPDGFPALGKGSQKMVSDADMEYLKAKRLLRETSNLDHPHSMERAYRTWKHIVERYTRARLTKPGDKLIALSGVAQRVRQKTGWVYVAGLWQSNRLQNNLSESNLSQISLESQLLWYVEPVWDTRSQQFLYPSSRPKPDRAPSFSWAAVDADQGVTYGELLEGGRLIQVEKLEQDNLDVDRMLGKTTMGYVELTSHANFPLRKIELSKRIQDNGIEYIWRLVRKEGTHANKFTIVYLDSPEADLDILGPAGRVYCLPAASGHQGEVAGDITCLLLQADENEHGTFKRVGLTIVSVLDKDGEDNIKKLTGYEAELPCRCCEADARGSAKKRHTIRIR